MADPKILKRGEDNLSAPSSNVHNEIYAFYTEKAFFWQKYEPIPLPLESASAFVSDDGWWLIFNEVRPFNLTVSFVTHQS